MRFQVVYDGPALEHNTMEVRDLAPALIALGELLEQANLTLNGADVPIQVRVEASFQRGSFGINFDIGSLWQSVLSLMPGHLSVESAKNLLADLGFVVDQLARGSTIGGVGFGLIQFLKWLRNRRIDKVELLQHGQVRVVVDKDQIVLEDRVLKLYRNYRLRQALENAVKVPLDKDGIDYFAVADPNASERFVEISREERVFFAAPPVSEEELEETDDTRNLQLLSVTFKEDNKWRFSDGSSTFYAAMEDPEFLSSVENGRAFSQGDILKVVIGTRQWLKGDKLHSDFAIKKVLEHRKAAVQISIPFARDPDSEA